MSNTAVIQNLACQARETDSLQVKSPRTGWSARPTPMIQCWVGERRSEPRLASCLIPASEHSIREYLVR